MKPVLVNVVRCYQTSISEGTIVASAIATPFVFAPVKDVSRAQLDRSILERERESNGEVT